MTPEIRKAAIRAAAKVALVVSVGCSGGSAAAPPSNAATGPDPAPAAATCEAHLASLAVVKAGELAADDPLHDRNDVFGEVFADVAARHDAHTQQCCTEVLGDVDAASKPYRWECCSALASVGTAQPFACTPWGPPCPPTMA